MNYELRIMKWGSHGQRFLTVGFLGVITERNTVTRGIQRRTHGQGSGSHDTPLVSWVFSSGNSLESQQSMNV
jgi:hypothetical protein